MSGYCTTSGWQVLVSLGQTPEAAPSAAPSATTETERESTSFKAVEGGGNVASGEVLLIQAYAVMWLLAFGLVLSSIRKQRKIDARITQLQNDLDKARGASGASD
jgi:CcmD family protein